MDDRKRVITDFPYFLYLFSIVFAGAGIVIFLMPETPKFIGAIFFVFGFTFLLLMPIVIVYVDRSRGLLEIVRIGLTGRRVEEILISRIAGVYVDQQYSNSEGSSYTYRVVIIKDDGEEVPLRKSTSSGRRQKVKWADAIRAELGVGGEDESPMSFREGLQHVLQPIPMMNQEAKTGISPGMNETNGISWQLETYTFGGSPDGSPMYRWTSTDFSTQGYFLYLAQRMEGVGKQSGLMNMVGDFLFRQSLRMYGFDETYTPGLAQAKTLEDVDRRLNEYFFVYTGNPEQARRLLNPWSVMPLVGWADRYALEPRDNNSHQISVLYSPLGVYVSVLNVLDPAQLDELVSLGVELVRAVQ